MDSKTYLEASERTDLSLFLYDRKAKCDTSELDIKLFHAAIGMAGETGEVAELVKKRYMYGKLFSKEEMLKECGDVLWYMAVMLRAVGGTFEEAMALNIAKLEQRYPEKFTQELAIERKDEK